LSCLAGGRLAAAAHRADVLALVISDVPGDDPGVVASGPTLPDATTFADARAVLARYAIEPSPRVAAHLANSVDETPKPGDARLQTSRAVIVASSAISLAAAAERAEADGVKTHILGDAIQGEARKVGRLMAATALAMQRGRAPRDPPVVLLSGGETTVTVTGRGRGGRN